MPDEAAPVPAAVPARIAWELGKDVVLVLALSRKAGVSHLTAYGKCATDQRIADRLARIVRELCVRDEPEEE